MALEAPRKNIVIVGTSVLMSSLHTCTSQHKANPSSSFTGGGIIGCTTAYFLTRHPLYSPATHKITILEATSIAAGASGKAGGLLALWAYPACIVPLSYRLHEELAKEHDGAKRWGYRQIYCGSVDCTGKVRERKGGKGVVADGEGREWNKLPKTKGGSIKKGRGDVPSDLDWLDGDTVKEYSVMGTPDTTAQVHPLLFTTSMADLAVSSGASIVLGKVTSINSSSSSVQSVTYTEKATQEVKTLEATDVIISAGPWTSKVFPAAPIEAMRAHSVVIKAEVAPYAIFSEIALPKGFNRTGGQGVETRRHGLSVSPEMYARPDGTVYACGMCCVLSSHSTYGELG